MRVILLIKRRIGGHAGKKLHIYTKDMYFLTDIKNTEIFTYVQNIKTYKLYK